MTKDRVTNPGWKSLQSQSERNMFRLAGLPAMILRKPHETYLKGIAIVEKLKLIEEQMTEWEDKQPIGTLELLPWWEALAFVEAAKPTGLRNGYVWRISAKGRGDYLWKNKKLP
jgi:hypothetical protein